ncbi:MAG: anthranilate synthase component I family protein [Acidobacteria bacterium]|nr:anthranilate synthase component I family protein [Acidobacteriota bacterium]
MEEDVFLNRAWRWLQSQPMACLLDSAGTIGERSETSYLSGPITRTIVDWGDRLESVERQRSSTITAIDLEAALRDVEQNTHGAVFSLVCYEGLNPWVKPSIPHPVWQGPRVIWAFTPEYWTYNRRRKTLTGPKMPDESAQTSPVGTEPDAIGWRDTQTEYEEKIRHIQLDIREGEYYQANLSQRFVGLFAETPQNIYMRLRQLNPSPYMGVFRWHGNWVLSGSPELLVSRRGSTLASRPIAGTRPRGQNPQDDQALRLELNSDSKEQAEHLMLVDLIRNDLGRIATPGGVNVPEYAVIESYSHVHHLVSQVTAMLAADKTNMDVLRSMFPGGTITGTPKIACMQALAKLEGEARGPYTGSMGIIRPGGAMDFNILIRTLIQRGSYVCFHGGGGIVADSQPTAEYAETLHKMKALMLALGMD